jgi:hypothetical protein
MKYLFSIGLPLASLISGIVALYLAWLAQSALIFYLCIASVFGSMAATLALCPSIFIFFPPGQKAVGSGNKVLGIILIGLGLLWVDLVVFFWCAGLMLANGSLGNNPAIPADSEPMRALAVWIYFALIAPITAANSVEASSSGGKVSLFSITWVAAGCALTVCLVLGMLLVRPMLPYVLIVAVTMIVTFIVQMRLLSVDPTREINA